MSQDSLFLKDNVQVEPLFDQWYIWSYLIPPATAARNFTERHLKIMDSYINAPQVHANAVKNPKMAGGPFIDYDVLRVAEIRALRDETKQKRTHLTELSAAIEKLDSTLRSQAKGHCLRTLYDTVPDPLKGYVELVYDLNNNPSFRIIEPLIYKSQYFDRSTQSLMLSITSGDDRPFVLSTPRLESHDSLHLRIPFDSEVVDALFRLKRNPQPFAKIRDLLGVPDREEQLLRSFFTSDPPKPYVPYTGRGIRWRYFGHACILVETGGVTLLLDPVLSYTYESNVSRYTYSDLPDRIDYVLITHNHQDHILFETLLQIRHKVGNIIVPKNSGGFLQDPSVRLLLSQVGFNQVIELGEMESLQTEDGCITALPFLGEHADLNILSKTGYQFRSGKHSLLFMADSCNIQPDLYRHVHGCTGDSDALFVGMECDGAPLTWLYGPLLTQRIERGMDESRRLAGSNFDQAIDIVRRFNCKETYVYAMGQEPWLNYVMSLKYTPESRPIVESNRLIAECCSHGIVAERLFGEKEILLNN